MTVAASIAPPALQALLARQPCSGLLVGLREGSNSLILSTAYCGLEDLAASRGASPSGPASHQSPGCTWRPLPPPGRLMSLAPLPAPPMPAELLAGLLPPPLAVLGAHVASAEDAAAAQRALGADSFVAVPAAGGSGLECFVGKGPRASLPAAPGSSSNGGSGASIGVAEALNAGYLPLRCGVELVLQVEEPAGAAGDTAPAPSKAALGAAFERLRQQVCGPGAVFLAGAAAGAGGGAAAAGEGQPTKLALAGGCRWGRGGGRRELLGRR